jgi:hypothetical protein
MNPGTCAVCGASRNDDRQYVDFGLTVDYIGVIYFCTFCVQELVNRMGCLTREQSEKLENELDSARQTILNFQAEKAAYDGAISTLRGTGLFSGTDLSVITDPAHSIIPEQDIIAEPERPKQDAPGSNQQTEQSDSKQRPDDLSEFGSDEFGLTL